MAEELLDGANVVTGFEEVGRKAVAKGVTRRRFADLRGFDGDVECPLNHGLVKMVAPTFARDWLAVDARRGEDPLPRPIA